MDESQAMVDVEWNNDGEDPVGFVLLAFFMCRTEISLSQNATIFRFLCCLIQVVNSTQLLAVAAAIEIE